MPFDESLTNLVYLLAALFPLPEQGVGVAQEAGLNTLLIPFRPAAIDNWHAILTEADKVNKVADVVKVARRRYPDDVYLKQAAEGELRAVRGPVLGRDLTWKSEEPSGTAEQLMQEQPTFLPVNFFEVGLQRARPVARVLFPAGGSATGFLITDNLFVTNHHIFRAPDDAKIAVIQFNYQLTADGLNAPSATFHLDPDNGFATSSEEEHDWTVVRVKGDANKDWGALEMRPTQVKVETTRRVNIIQHPGGEQKQIALYHNVLVYADENRLQYLTDTLPGSSGSPVFDSQWHLIGLHHSGGWIRDPGTKGRVYRNEGININRVIQGVQESGLAG